MRRILSLLGIAAVVGAVVAFVRRKKSDDDEFLDEELES
ncbi:MAG TPA: hypothetical protein VIM86_11045 [Thermodesulfobacteriota bacterium]